MLQVNQELGSLLSSNEKCVLDLRAKLHQARSTTQALHGQLLQLLQTQEVRSAAIVFLHTFSRTPKRCPVQPLFSAPANPSTVIKLEAHRDARAAPVAHPHEAGKAEEARASWSGPAAPAGRATEFATATA